jgi:hypothetical protein
MKCSKGGGDRNHLAEVKFKWKNAKSFWPAIVEKSKRTMKILHGEVSKSHGPLDIIYL